MKRILSLIAIMCICLSANSQVLVTLVKTKVFDQNGSAQSVTSETIRVCTENISSVEPSGGGSIVMLKYPQKLDGGTVTGYSVTATPDQINTAVGTVSATMSLSDGSVSAPSGAWASEAASGDYRIGANNYGYAVNGVKIYEVSTTAFIPSLILVTNSTQTLTGAGAVNLTTMNTLLVTTGANALTLAAGVEGQRKFIRMKTDGGDGTLTVTNLQGGTTLTFNDAADFVELYYIDAKWHIVVNSGATLA